MNPFVSNGEPRLNVPSLLERGLNMHFSPKIRHILPLCDNCEIKNGKKRVKKFGQPWLTLRVQLFCYVYLLLIFLRACKTKELPISLTLFLFVFFHCSSMKIRPGRAGKSEKVSLAYLLTI